MNLVTHWSISEEIIKRFLHEVGKVMISYSTIITNIGEKGGYALRSQTVVTLTRAVTNDPTMNSLVAYSYATTTNNLNPQAVMRKVREILWPASSTFTLKEAFAFHEATGR